MRRSVPMPNRARLSSADRAALQWLADNPYRLVAQVTGWRALERRGLIRVRFGPLDTADVDRLCCFITEKGREALR